ncbi:glycerophosphodiester phosphodiesterase [Paenibacillus humicola]|uniref:glycerophosphodiester phosphodiesterase n=1 Tax=Paenibacillus humicola TaxID=3110540 RepID=UPI00237C46C4|nr:glycerophosphodiester phosphodiesterase family protein [Paenibacillus humicola]
MANPCAAHRGASGLAPENTMAAFRKALSFPFVQWIELDVQLSRDGVPVVIHDDRLHRTTSGYGKVGDFDASYLRTLDAGGWFSKAYVGERIPLLEQVLGELVGRCRFNIELKTYGGRYPGMERRVVEMLYGKGMQYDTVITSFDPEALTAVRRLSDDVRTGLITDTAPRTLPGDLRRLGATFLSIGYKRVSRALLEAMRASGTDVMAWTVNDIGAIRKLAAMDGELMICTNYPDRFARALLPPPDVPSPDPR